MPDWYIEYRLPIFLLQSVLGVLPFSTYLNKRDKFPQRFCGSTLLLMVLIYLIKIGVFSDPEIFASGPVRVLMSLVTYLFLIVICFFIFDENIFTALFISASGYIAQDMAGTTKTFLRVIPFVDAISNHPVGILILDAFVYGGMYLLLYFTLKPFTRQRDSSFGDREKAVFSALVLVFCIGMARLTIDNPQRNAWSVASESVYQFLCDVLILLLQFGIMERHRLAKGVESYRELVHEQYDQMKRSKESVDLVNEKYHDLKSILDKMEAHFSKEQVEKLRDKISEYDTFLTTGSDIIDVVLAEKSALCRQKGIELTTMVGGKSFDFMEEIELYSLFGNLLNNAIEAASKVPAEKRFITLNTSDDGSIVSIHSENPYEGEVDIVGNIPVSHRDRDYHGFGIKSIERTVKKYDGTVVAKTEQGLFILDIVMIKP